MALTVVINDDFTDADGTLLTAHTPTTDGTGWTKLSGVNDSIKIISNGLECPYHNDAGYSWYTANVTEAATDAQRITTVVGAVNPRDNLTVGARLQSDTSSVKGYLLELNDGSNLVRLYRVDAGVLTQVDAASAIQVAVGSTIIWEITAAGVHTVKHDGSLITWNTSATTSVTDNTHTGGKVGIVGRRTVDGAAIDSFIGEYDAAAGTPATFSGTIPAQTFTNGDAVSVDLSSYFSGTATPFSYANTGTALTGTGLSINASTGFLEGTATTGSVTGVIATATDADTATADSNAFNVTVNASVTPISFSGTVADQAPAVDAPFSLDLSTYFSGSETPFSYALTTGALPTGLTLNTSTGVIEGTPTAEESSAGISVTATDAGANTAITNTFSINIDATAWGVLGSEIPSSGASGPGFLYKFLDLPTDNTNRFRFNVLVQPTAGTLTTYPDSSATFSGAPVGNYFFKFESFKNNVLDLITFVYLNVTDESTANITATGTPDGTYPVNIFNPTDDALIFSGDVEFVSGAASIPTIPLAVGAQWRGVVFDNNATPNDGAAIVGVTS